MYVATTPPSFKKIHRRKPEKMYCQFCSLCLCWRHKNRKYTDVFLWARADFLSFPHHPLFCALVWMNWGSAREKRTDQHITSVEQRKKSESPTGIEPIESGGCPIHWATRTHGEHDHPAGVVNYNIINDLLNRQQNGPGNPTIIVP